MAISAPFSLTLLIITACLAVAWFIGCWIDRHQNLIRWLMGWCRQCGSHYVEPIDDTSRCLNCGHKWPTDAPREKNQDAC